MTAATKEKIEDPLIGMLLADRYRVTRIAGEGGMGRVYLGQHEAIGRKVAIKCLLPELAEHPGIVERFQREARAATACGSEHIIDVFDMGTLPDGSPFMVMEFLEGEDLGQVLDREGAQPTGRVVRILSQACDALETAHAAGIVHRDLKPENLYLIQRKRATDFVKVLDFGISKFTEHAAGINKHLTQTGVTVGTPLYMSPEQAQGLKSTDHRTDIYALGVILYEGLTGRPPFDADSFALLIVQIITGATPDVRALRPDVPEELAFVIRRCLAKAPENRYDSVQELNAALQPFMELDETPQLLEARTSQFPDQGGTQRAGGPMTSAGLAEAEPAGATRVERRTPQTAPLADLAATPPPANAIAGLTNTRSPMMMLGSALVVVGALAFGAAAFMSRESEPVVVTPDVTPESNDDPPTSEMGQTAAAGDLENTEDVRLRVVVAPAEARIFLDDVEYPSPLDARLPRGQAPQRLRIELDGYQTHEEPVMLDQDREILRMLQPTQPTRVYGSMSRPSMTTMTAAMDVATNSGEDVTPMITMQQMNNPTEMTESTSMMNDGFRDQF